MVQKKNGAGLLIFLGWLVYTTAYLGKVNYSANITQIVDFYGVTRAQAGTAPTFMFLAYGAGQVFNGLFCKKYNLKWMIFSSMLVSAAVNLIVAVTTNFAIIKWLWMVNGFALSILWPSLIRLLSENLPQKDVGRSGVIMGTTMSGGTLLIYGLSSLYAAFGKFKLAFYTAAIVVIVVAVIWLFLQKKATTLAKSGMEEELEVSTEEAPQERFVLQKGDKKLFLGTFGTLCFFAVSVNLIKDGLTTWVPSVLKESFAMSDSLSILLALLLPVLAMFGNALALGIHKKLTDYVAQCVITFGVMLVLIGLILGSLNLRLAAVMLVGLICVSFLASSLNSLLTSIFPMFMRKMGNSGRMAGLINGFCYVGSTISSYGLGVVADHRGWTAVFSTLIGACALVCLTGAGYACFKQVIKRKEGLSQGLWS